jgi:hypothetical protein
VRPAIDEHRVAVELVADSTRDEYLARLREVGDAGRDVDRHPGESHVEQLALAGVDAGAELDPECRRGDANLFSTGHRLRRRVELDQEAVVAIRDHVSSDSADFARDDRLVLGQ